jgi:hypothetical protein
MLIDEKEEVSKSKGILEKQKAMTEKYADQYVDELRYIFLIEKKRSYAEWLKA